MSRSLSWMLGAALLFTGIADGAPECVQCHRDQARTQPSTDMARALLLSGSNDVLQQHPKLSVRRGIYSYSVDTGDGRSTYTVSDTKGSIAVPIRWSFGARSQTWILEYQGQLYESLVSYFAAINGLDVTIGDNSIHPQTLLEALGRELSDTEVRSCFNCHATRAIVHNQLDLNALAPGVQCERCHTGAEQHREALVRGKAGPIPQKLGELTSEDMSGFCGQCHRTWDRVVRDRLFGEINVRFQPYRLANSKCYDGGDRRLSCTACHDPHRNVARDVSFYDSKCLQCHIVAKKVGSAAVKVCPVATTGCSGCHMPKIELPGGHMTFTDHQIRVVRAGDAYPN